MIWRDRPSWQFSDKAPAFFPGSCGACCSLAYHIKVFENDSALTELARREIDGTTANYVSGLKWDGTKLLVNRQQGASTEPLVRGILMDVALADLQEINYDYKWDPSFNQSNIPLAVNRAPNGDVVMNARRITATATPAVVSKADDDTLNWETCLDSGAIGGCVAGDSTGNVYASADEGTAHLYLFDSSGTKQWKTSIPSSANNGSVIVDSADYCWISSDDGAITSYLTRVDPSGAIATTITITDFTVFESQSHMWSDGSTGVWLSGRRRPFTTYQIRRYDSTGALVTVIATSTLLLPFAVDSSNNVYTYHSDGVGGTNYYIKKYNSSGTLQWTSPSIVWSGVFAMAVDDDYVFVGGTYKAS